MYLKIIFSAVAREAAICAKGETRGDRRLETTPAVGLLRQRVTYDTFWRRFYAVLTTRWRIRNDWHMIHFGGHFTQSSQRGQEFATIDIWYILADILRCPHNEVKNSQRWTLIARQLFTTHRFSYEFNIFLTSDYNKRWRDLYFTPSTEYWNCKVGFGFSSWMLECCALNFQEQVIIC